MGIRKIILTVAGFCVISGAIISVAAVMMSVSSAKNNRQKITEEVPLPISAVNISANVGDIKIITSNTDKIILDYSEDNLNKYALSVDGGVLTLQNQPHDVKKSWHDYIMNIDFRPKNYYDIVLTLPRDFSADMQISSKYGSIKAANLQGSLNAQLKYGDIKISGSTLDSLVCSLDCGDADIEDVRAENVRIDNDFGDISLNNVQGMRVFAKCDYGDIEADMLAAERIEFENDCGDIECKINGSESDYAVNAKTRLGDIDTPTTSGGKYSINAATDLGDIEIKFLR